MKSKYCICTVMAIASTDSSCIFCLVKTGVTAGPSHSFASICIITIAAGFVAMFTYAWRNGNELCVFSFSSISNSASTVN